MTDRHHGLVVVFDEPKRTDDAEAIAGLIKQIKGVCAVQLGNPAIVEDIARIAQADPSESEIQREFEWLLSNGFEARNFTTTVDIAQATLAARREERERACLVYSSMIMNVLSGAKRYRADAGFIRWGLVEKDIHAAFRDLDNEDPK